MPTLNDDNASSLRTFVDNVHNILRTLKSYSHGADLKAAGNMQDMYALLRLAAFQTLSELLLFTALQGPNIYEKFT